VEAARKGVESGPVYSTEDGDLAGGEGKATHGRLGKEGGASVYNSGFRGRNKVKTPSRASREVRLKRQRKIDSRRLMPHTCKASTREEFWKREATINFRRKREGLSWEHRLSHRALREIDAFC